MGPMIARIWGGRVVATGALAAAALSVFAVADAGLRVREVKQASSIRAPWVETCARQMERARLRLTEVAPEFAHGDVRQAWSTRAAWAELALAPQYSARIELRPSDEAPSVFDWEEASTPVVGSFALHRHVGHFDLLVVADDSDGRGLMFAARMQPLLDDCLMGAK
ncbi:MAG: hypothetical protein JWN44_2088 [Myxococcales bacterium]|nr:hypothetical protein [Myxococcales bacterium]